MLLQVTLCTEPERAAQNGKIKQSIVCQCFNESVTVIWREIAFVVSHVESYLVHLGCLVDGTANEQDFFHWPDRHIISFDVTGI